MKKRNYKLHLIYLLCITVLTVGGIALFVLMRNARAELLMEARAADTLDREHLIGAIEQAEGALRMAAHTESPAVYAAKMQQLAEGCAGAAILTEQRDPASVWGMFWARLSEFAEGEIASAIGTESVSPDRTLLNECANIMAKLKKEPEAIEGPLWELPKGLEMPSLQTEFSQGEEELRTTAAKLLGVSSGVLKKVDSGLPGIARYKCANAEIDLLISGKLVYLDLQLPPKEGNIGKSECIRRLTEFAGQEGYDKAEVVDLYENEGILWAKLVPTVKMTYFGSVKNLDRPLIAACTLWSGRVCHFEVKASQGIEESTDSISGVGGEIGIAAEKLLSEKRMKKLAEDKNATLGDAVICKGKLCRTLIVDEEADERTIHLYVDASDGSEREMAIVYSPLPEELPASVDWERTSLPMGRDLLPPYADWQRRRCRTAMLDAVHGNV